MAPLFKNDSRCDPLTSRSMSLTSVCCKALERVIVPQLIGYLELNSLFSVNQLGPCKGKSVEDQL